MLMAAEKSTRIVVKSEISDDWEKLRTRTGLSQQEVFDRLVRFLLEQDEVAQAMILRTLQPKADLVEFVLSRLSVGGNERTDRPIRIAQIQGTKSKPKA